MNILKNGLLIVVAIVIINIFADEESPVGGSATVQSDAGSAQEGPVPEGHVRIVFSDGRTQDYPNNILTNLPHLKKMIGNLPDEQDLLLLGFENAEDLEGRFELVVKISNATQENMQAVRNELEARTFNDVLKIAKMLDFFMFEDTKNLGLENKIAQILYRKFQELTVAERAAINLEGYQNAYGFNGKFGFSEAGLGFIGRFIHNFSFSPDGSLVGIRNAFNHFQLYRVSDYQPVGNRMILVDNFSFSPDRLFIGIKDTNNQFQLYRLNDHQPVGNPIQNVFDFSFSQDGSLIGIIDRNSNFQLYSVSDQQPIGNVIPNVGSFSFSPDGLLIGIQDRNSNFQLYSVKDQQLIGSVIQNVDNFSFSPDRLFIGIKDTNNQFKLYHLTDQQLIGSVIQNVDKFLFSSDGSLIGIKDINNYFQLYRVNDQQLVGNPIQNVVNFSFTPDGLLGIQICKNVKNYRATVRRIIQLYQIYNNNLLQIGDINGAITYFSFSQDGSLLGAIYFMQNFQVYKRESFLEFIKNNIAKARKKLELKKP